jgi:PPK2 family polyphosphate:nucleotide phosphotransferase
VTATDTPTGGPTVRQALRVPRELDLTALDPGGRPVGPQGKKAAAAAMDELGARLAALQEALFAEAAGGGRRAVLLVLQGMDTSGKGGVIAHVAGLVNPQGLHLASFKKPTREELAHDFLWRIRKQVPAAGSIGVFDRSHYEDVLVVRVDGLVPEPEWRARYGAIRDFEAELAGDGVTVVKCMLHISPQAQQERLHARLDDPAKRWKYNPGDVDVRARWADYRAA